MDVSELPGGVKHTVLVLILEGNAEDPVERHRPLDVAREQHHPGLPFRVPLYRGSLLSGLGQRPRRRPPGARHPPGRYRGPVRPGRHRGHPGPGGGGAPRRESSPPFGQGRRVGPGHLEQQRRGPPRRMGENRRPHVAKAPGQLGAQVLLVGLEGGHAGHHPFPPGPGRARGHAGQEVHRRGGAGQQLVGQGAQLEAVGHGIGGREQLVGGQRGPQPGGGGDHPTVGTEELVGRAGVEVGADGRHVDGGVGGEVDPVDEEQARCPVDLGGDPGQVGSGPDEVGRPGYRDQTRA
jgi:hypothetical protein